MKVTVFVLSMLIVAPAYAQRGGAPRRRRQPKPSRREFRASSRREPKSRSSRTGSGAAKGPSRCPTAARSSPSQAPAVVHKIDKNGTITTFLENTNRANGLALDSKGRLIAATALTVEVLYPKGSKTVLAKMPTRPNDLVVDKKDGVYFTLPSNKPPVVYYIPAGGQPAIVGEVRSPHGIQLSPDEKTLYVGDSAGDVPRRVRRAAGRQADEQAQLREIRRRQKDRGRRWCRKPRRRDRGRQRGADLRGYGAGRPDIQQVGPISRNHSDVAAPAEPGIRRAPTKRRCISRAGAPFSRSRCWRRDIADARNNAMGVRSLWTLDLGLGTPNSVKMRVAADEDRSVRHRHRRERGAVELTGRELLEHLPGRNDAWPRLPRSGNRFFRRRRSATRSGCRRCAAASAPFRSSHPRRSARPGR